ncbi:AlpA family transcriptional regulator [Idiomarina abyssalis]|nr:AlpA family transcriptional regulator [Idiomarina abyssalis]
MALLKIKDLQERYNLSRAAMYRWRKSPDFPKPVTPEEVHPRWSLEDLLDWESRNQSVA